MDKILLTEIPEPAVKLDEYGHGIYMGIAKNLLAQGRLTTLTAADTLRFARMQQDMRATGRLPFERKAWYFEDVSFVDGAVEIVDHGLSDRRPRPLN
ncbi:MAG: hypothetical protein ACYCZ0_05115 [Minisyncoccota bacterium]